MQTMDGRERALELDCEFELDRESVLEHDCDSPSLPLCRCEELLPVVLFVAVDLMILLFFEISAIPRTQLPRRFLQNPMIV